MTSLDEAVSTAATGDIWLFRGRSLADRAIRAVTNSPINHVGMVVALDDLPPLFWHAELGRSLPDVWTGERQRGVQLHKLRDGSLEQITRDDSYVQLLVDEGHITQEAAGSHPQRNLVLQALTGEEVMEPAMTVLEARPGDRFLLCSDGLSDVVGHAALTVALGEGEPQETVARLIELALENRTRDNVTAIVADVIEEE